MRVLCATSNAYVRCLPAFAAEFQRFWSPYQLVHVVCYEAPWPDGIHPSIRPYRVGRQEDLSWSQGLARYLEDVPRSDVVLLMLDDYWLSAPVDVERLTCLERLMARDQRIGKIDLSGDRMQFPHLTHLPGNHDADPAVNLDYGYGCGPLVAADCDPAKYNPEGGFRYRLFLASLQAALWRVGFLRDLLRLDESAWEFERYGTVRLLGTPTGTILGVREPVLRYSNAIKTGKPKRLMTDKLAPGQFQRLRDQGLLGDWGFAPKGGVLVG